MEGELVIRGQAFKVSTLGDLVLMIVRLRYERGLNEKAAEKIRLAGKTYGLLDCDDRPTAKYFALMSDEAEQLARELTGMKETSGLCACGCRRIVRGRAKTANQTCRKRLSRILAA